jgi:DNA mismatch endonuclease (patch repair protein)
MTDIVDAPTRSRMMSKIRNRDTKPELLLRRALWHRNVRGYRCHYARAPGRPDICFVRRRLAVFVDGAFWHGHPDYFVFGKSGPQWDAKIRRNAERDKEVDSELFRLGWRSFRAWDFEVLEDAESIARRISALLAMEAQDAPARPASPEN